MPTTPTRRWKWIPALLVLLAFAAAACSSSNNNASTSNSSTSGSGSSSSGSSASGLNIDYKTLTGALNGSGSTFQDPYDQKIITDFHGKAPGLAVTYTKSGSGAGKQDLANQVVQFAGTDSTIKDADKPTFKGGTVLYFPTVAAPITVSFNLQGVDKLKLSPEALGGIFSTKITTWNDPKIAADNPGVTLPNTPIVVVHRSDASGTTSNFTKYLTKADPTDWTLGSSDSVNWPTTTQAAEKNSGVASLISSTNGAVGYVDLADAVNANLHTATIKNASGNFVDPTLKGASAAVAGATVNPDLTYDPINAQGADAYPITSPTWIIVYQKQPDAATANNIKGFLNYILTDGQATANSVGYAPLPSSMQQQAIAQLNQITS